MALNGINTELERLRKAKQDLRTSIQKQGVPIADGTNISEYSQAVDGISTVRSVAGKKPDTTGDVSITVADLGGISNIKVGNTTTGKAGSLAQVTVQKQNDIATLDFVIPTGKDGVAASIQVGTVTTGAAGTNASVSNVGTSNEVKLNFTIPRGEVGAKGNDGYTPQKGTDYWTDTDRQSVISEVLQNTYHQYITKTISLTSWQTVSENVFASSFTDAKIPADCKLDIALNTTDLLQLMNDGVGSIRADNDNGTVQIVCIGAQPTADITAQISFVKLQQA